MKEEINQALHIVEILIICILAFIMQATEDTRQRQAAEIAREIKQVNSEVQAMQKELKHNDNIVLKILEQEW